MPEFFEKSPFQELKNTFISRGDITCEAGMMCGTAENQVPEWRATVVVYQNSGKKRVLDLTAWLFWFFFRQAAGILLKLRWNFGIMGLEVCRSGSVKCIWEIPNKEDTFSLEENPFDFRGTMPLGVL